MREEDKKNDIKLTPKQISILIRISGLVFKPRDSIFGGVPSQIISTLAQSSPANNSDLQALVYSQLCVIREELRHGSTDGFKIFGMLILTPGQIKMPGQKTMDVIAY